MKTLGVICGRFQPVTNSHYSIIQRSLKENDTTLVVLAGNNKRERNKNPLTYKLVKRLIREIDNKIEIVKFDKFIVTTIDQYLEDYPSYELVTMYAGSGRIEDYRRIFEYYGKEENKVKVILQEIYRKSTDESSTLARDCAVKGDFSKFEKYIPDIYSDKRFIFESIRNGLRMNELRKGAR